MQDHKAWPIEQTISRKIIDARHHLSTRPDRARGRKQTGNALGEISHKHRHHLLLVANCDLAGCYFPVLTTGKTVQRELGMLGCYHLSILKRDLDKTEFRCGAIPTYQSLWMVRRYTKMQFIS